jgi:hypothetical protein
MPDPFIAPQDLVDYLGRGTITDPGMIIATDAACDTVRTIAEQTFNQSTSTVTLDGTGTDALLLPELPVTSAGTVTVAGGTITDYVVNTRLGDADPQGERHRRRLHERVPDVDVAGGPPEHRRDLPARLRGRRSSA